MSLFDIISFIAALISIAVGVVALIYAWQVNKASTARLNEIQNANEEANKINKEAKQINVDNQNSLNKITELAIGLDAYVVKLHSEQMKILEKINIILRNSSNFSSESDRATLEKELQQHQNALEQLNEEGNALHQLFLDSLH